MSNSGLGVTGTFWVVGGDVYSEIVSETETAELGKVSVRFLEVCPHLLRNTPG